MHPSITKFQAPLFRIPIYVCTEPKEAEPFFPVDYEVDLSAKGLCVEFWPTHGPYSVWILLNSLEPSTCCHESVHAAINIMHNAGAGFTYDEQETLAYLTDNIFSFTREAVLAHLERIGK